MNNKSYILFLAVFVSALLVSQNITGFTFLYSSDSSDYYLSDELATWQDANQECINQGGHLVAINSQEEQETLFSSVMNTTFSTFWIGLNDLNSEGNFVWTNGDVFDYENWNTQNVNDPEPNGFNNSPFFQEDVVEVQSGQNSPQNAGFWNDAPEDSNRFYVLEMSSLDCDSDITPPVITVVGGEEIVFLASDVDSYVDQGAACVDDFDGFISQNVEVSGDVPNLAVPGTYNILYECSDACGNTSEATRTVIVHDQICDVFVTPVVSNLCDGNWLVYFDFTYESEFPGLEDVIPLFTASSGDIVNFQETTLEFNSLYDCAFVIDSPGLYNVSFLTNTDCTFGEYQIDIPEQIDVSVNATINNPDCFGDLGNYSGSLDGPSGIYQIYLNNENYGSVSIGLENIEFDTWTGNDAVDCEGNNLSAEPGSSFVIALNEISGLNVGDQIGAFFLHPSCGLFNAGSAVYQGTNTVVSIWADDSGTSEIEGFTPGQNIVWLVNSLSDGLIYNADITWDESLYPSGDFFIPNGLASTASINIGDTYEDSFSIDLPSGLYDVTVQDGDCILFEENDVEIITPLSINDITTDVQDNICATLNEGVISINGLSPDSEYVFSLIFLNNPSLIFELDNTIFNDLPSGIYSLGINDLSCGEEIVLPIFINSPPEIEITAVSSDFNGYGVLCNSANNGYIDITVEGGAGDYTYLWSNNFTSQDISGLGAGLYSVIVTDQNGCFAAYPVDITEPDEITIDANISNYNGYGVSCNGGIDGFIEITVEGGSGNYSYDWDAWTGTQNLYNIEAGNYEITVVDSEGCQAVSQFSISEPDELEASIDVVNVSCFGNLGSATLLISGGSGAYSLNGFNFGSEGIFIGSLEPGNYTFLVSDDDGCDVEVSFVIEGPTEPLNVITSVIDVVCPGGLGSATFNISGGTSPYNYDPQNDLSPGDYSVVVTDSNGCPTVVEFEIQEPPDQLDLLFNITPDCYDPSSSNQSQNPQGALSMTFLGGSPPYLVTINGVFDNVYAEEDTAFYNNLSSGLYEFIVLDGNSCEFNASQELTSNTPIDVSYSGQPYNCSDEPDAFFSINITGGISPYSYSWHDGVNSIDGTSETGVLEFNNLVTGSYFLYIEDSLGCNPSSFLGVPISLDSLFDANFLTGPSFIMDVSQVEPLDINYDFTQPLVCIDDTLSSLSFSISQTGDFISNNFNLFIDSSGVAIDSLLITPGSISLDFCFPALNNGLSQSIVTNVNGNDIDFNQDGNIDVAFPPFNTNMLDGDIFGFFNLVNPNLLASGYQCVGGIQGGDLNCGPNSNFAAPLTYSNEVFNDGNLSFITWFEESLSPDLGILSSSNPNFISNTPVGFVNRDGLIYGCQIEFFTASLPGQNFVDTYIPNTFMYISSIIVDPEPFTGSDGQSVISILNPSYNDDYEFIIVDQFGCSQIIEIDFPAPQEDLTASMTITNDLSCITASDATLSVLPSGGYGDYNVYLYTCDPLSGDCDNFELIDSINSIISCPVLGNECNTYDFSNLSSGQYYVSIVDSLGCVRESAVESIFPPFPIELNYDTSNYNGFGVSCNGGSDGSVNLTVSGGSGNYSYTWFQNSVPFITTLEPNLLNVEAALYSVVITDDNGCESEPYDITITEPSELVFDAIIDPILCYNDTGDIVLSWSGGVPFETGGEYQFIQPTGVDPDGANTAITIENSAIGPNGSNGYFAEIAIDANGCQILFEVYMTEPDQIQLLGDISAYISDYNGFSTSCSNSNDGQIGIDVPLDVVGGIGQYSFEWYLNLGSNNESQLIDASQFGSSLTSLDGIPAGTYELIISDESGVDCSSESYIFNLTQPDVIGISPSENQLTMFSDYDGDGQEDVWLQELLYNDVDATLSIYGDYGVSCYGANNGFINIEVEGATGNYIYQWEADTDGDGINDFFSNSEDLYNLYPGVYNITITDQNYDFNNFDNCTINQTYILDEPSESVQVDLFVSNFDNNDINNVNVVSYEDDNILDYGVSCFGASDGFIYLENLVGGTGIYTYILNAIGDNNDTILVSSGNVSDLSIIDGYYVLNGLQAGSYMLSVFDSNYEFLADEWDNFSSSTNYQTCFLEVNIILTEPNEIILSETHSNYYATDEFEGYGVSCYGASDGSITVNAIGGDGIGLPLNYEYSWYGVEPGGNLIDPDDYIDLNGQENSPELNGIPAGTYVVTVYDERDCAQTLTVEISSPPDIDFIINQPTDYNNNVCFDISCFGADDGFINAQSLNADAGEGFSYIWIYNDDTLSVVDANISNLSPGYYQLIVQDNLTNCEKTFGPTYISEPPILYTSIDNIAISDFDGILGDNDYNGYSVSCVDASDGIISIEVEGGSGIYNAVVLDGFGEIIAEADASLSPQPCEIDVLVDTDIDNDGILNQNDIDIDGDGLSNDNDDLPYYPGSMSTVIDLSGLSAGNYSVIISDLYCPLIEDCGCSPIEINNIELTSPPEILDAEIIQLNSVSCFGLSDGSVFAEFSGGLPDNWNWGLYALGDEGDILIDTGVNLAETGQIYIDNLSAGIYRLDIYDINGFYVNNTNFSDLGLGAPEEFLSFNQGCFVSLPFEINQPLLIDTTNFNITSPCFIYENNLDSLIVPDDGVIAMDIIGGVSPFNIFINDDFVGSYESNVEISGLSLGNYTLSVFDVNNCSSIFDIEITANIDAPSQVFVNNIDLDQDGVYDHIRLPDCEFSLDGFISVPEITSDVDPEFNYTHFWGVDVDFDGQYDYTSLDDMLLDISTGVYSLNITDNVSGCTFIYDYLIEESLDCYEVPTAFSPNGDGVNDYWVIGGMDEYIDAEVEIYNRWGQLVFYTPDNSIYWDGVYNGKNMPTADYFFIIKNPGGDVLSHGRVTLRR